MVQGRKILQKETSVALEEVEGSGNENAWCRIMDVSCVRYGMTERVKGIVTALVENHKFYTTSAT